MSHPPILALDGYTDVPAGHIAAVVTYLEMLAPPPTAPAAEIAGAGLARLGAAGEARYAAIFRRLGERWIWFSRLMITAPERAAIIGDEDVEAFAFTLNGADAGLLELDFRTEGEAELAFFGLYDGAVGKGAGRWLMARALERAWSRPGVERLFVHTCTLDHPRALGFYRKCGFVGYRTALEVMPDPRLSGVLPRDAAPHVPIIEAGAGPS